VYFGAFGTPFDTDHIDLDLVLDLSAAEAGFDLITVAPGFELNFDARPDMSSWGLYLLSYLPIYRRDAISAAGGYTGTAPLARETALEIESTLGAYYMLADRHQLLLEYDMTFRPDPTDDERSAEVGAIAFGYNVLVNDALELRTQVFVDIPQRDEEPAVGLMAGLITFLPGPKPKLDHPNITIPGRRSPLLSEPQHDTPPLVSAQAWSSPTASWTTVELNPGTGY